MSDVTEWGPASSVVRVAVLMPDGDTIVRRRLKYARTVTPEDEFQTNRFEGDDGSQSQDELLAQNLTVLCDKQDFDNIQEVYGKTRVTEGLDPEALWRMYEGDDAEIAGVRPIGLEVYTRFKDESVTPNVSRLIRRTYPLGTMKAQRVQQAEWKAKFVMQWNFTAEKTTVDVVGDTLPEVDSGGIYRFVEVLTALPAELQGFN